MNIEMWSDIACPFCYIGKRRLELALTSFPHRDKVKVIYRSFELDPNAPRDIELDVYDILSKKYGTSREQAISMSAGVAEQARSVGLTFNFDTMVLTNTFDAHRLIHHAGKQGLAGEMKERLLYAYFTESRHLGDHETLATLAEETGLDRSDVLRMLKEGDYTEVVRADEQEAERLRIRGVPYFVVNRKYAISGAQPVEAFAGALEQIWAEEQPLTVLREGGSGCTPDGACDVPESGR